MMVALLLAFVALVLIRPQEYPGMESFPVPVLPLALLAALGAWLLTPGRKRFEQPTYPLLLAFVVVCMASMVASGWAGGALVRLQEFIPTLIAFVLVAQAARDPANLLRLMAVIALCAAVMALHGVEQAQLGEGWTGIPTIQDGRIQYVGIFNDPNDLAMVFVIGVPFALMLAAAGGVRRLAWWSVALLLVYGIYLTDSRGAFLAVMVMAGLWVWRRRGLLTAGMLGVAGLSVLMMLPTRMQELDASEASAYGRIDAWYEGIQMFIANPLLGVGMNNFSDHHHLTAHNSFVLVLAETGLAGFTLWLAFVGYAFLMTIAVLRHRPALAGPADAARLRDERTAATTLLLALAGFFACAFFLSRSYVIVLYILVGLVTGWYAGARDRWPGLPVFQPVADLPKWGVVALGGAVALWLVVKVLLMMAWS